MNIGKKILEKSVDIALIAIFYNLEMLGTQRKDWGKVPEWVEEDFRKYNYDTLKRSVSYLKEKGLVQAGIEKLSLPQITKAGEIKLASILPKYDEKRIWDKRIYIVTYDLPINKNKERNYLRSFLKKIGCGILQKSVWVSPYNPTKLLDQFAKEKNLNGLIVVSSIGKDGTIGNTDIKDLFIELFKLHQLNEDYKEFILHAKQGKLTKEQFVFYFLNILSKDPQLPFSLLPDWWVGDKAYKYFYKITH